MPNSRLMTLPSRFGTSLHLTAALSDYDHVRDLASGLVQPNGITLTTLTLPVEETFFRFLKDREWDVSELSMGKYAAMRAMGDHSVIAIPVFPSRMFRHSSFYVRADSDLRSAADLRGRRVGIPEWGQSASVYSRGFLVHQYGIGLREIQWVQAGVNMKGRGEKLEFTLPAGVAVERRPDTTLDDLLLAGGIDAMASAHPPRSFERGDPRVRRLFEDYRAVEEQSFRDTGVFPIMHTVAIRAEVLEQAPWAAMELFKAFEEAKRRSVARMRDFTAARVPFAWGAHAAQQAEALFGADPWPYGIEPNRVTLDAFLGFAHEQGLCPVRLKPEDLFPPQFRHSFII